MKLNEAGAMVISFGDISSSLRILEEVRESNKYLPIIVRCKDDKELSVLEKHGATRIVTEAFEESLTMAYYLLREINVPATHASHLVDRVRHKQYDLLRQVFRGEFDEEEGLENSTDDSESLHLIQITDEAYAIKKSIAELNLSHYHIELISMRHPGQHTFTPHSETQVCANDILIVYGSSDAATKAEKYLLKGK